MFKLFSRESLYPEDSALPFTMATHAPKLSRSLRRLPPGASTDRCVALGAQCGRAGTVMNWISDHQPLPATEMALGPDSDAPGLLAVGPRVTPQRLREAYSIGAFPWYCPGQPPLWWTPDPRMVLPVAEFKLSNSLRKTLRRFVRNPGCEIRIDSAFRAVMRACAESPRAGQNGTWIVPEIIDAYSAWHESAGPPQGRIPECAARRDANQAGSVHSVETWIDGELVGGLYGVNLGTMFFGESMFASRTDASKIALAALVAFCRANHIPLIDCQQATDHLAAFGAREIARPAFEAHLARMLRAAAPADWSYHPRLWAQLGLAANSPADATHPA